MAAGVELPEGRAGGGGIAMEFPAGDEDSFSSPPRLPKRLRRRLLDAECKSPSTVEEIEAKLRDADLRRHVSLRFYSKSVCVCCLVGDKVKGLKTEVIFSFRTCSPRVIDFLNRFSGRNISVLEINLFC